MSPSPLDLQVRTNSSTPKVSDEPKFAVQDIGPDEAIEYLGHNTHNRSLRFRVVDAYASDMKQGNWRQGVGSILVAADGTIIDGQHRLHAIVESETTQRMFVVTDLPMDAQEVVDAGAKRTFADILKLRKETRWNILAAVTRRAEIWAIGARALKGNFQPTNSQLLQRLEKSPELRISTEVADYVRTRVPISASVIGLTHWLFNRIEVDTDEDRERLSEDISTFFERLRDGAELTKDHPVYVLRRTAIDNRNSSHARLREEVMIAYVIKAWNAYRDGRTITLLRYRPGGSSPEKFPEPI